MHLRKGGLFAAAAVLLGAVVLAGAPAAYADEEPSLNANFNDATLGVEPAPGKAVPLNVSGYSVMNPKVTIDTSGLQGVARVDPPKNCTASGTTITCLLAALEPALNGLPLPVVFHPAHGAAVGAKGTVSVTTSGSNVQSNTSSATVTLADGVDLVVTSRAGTQKHKVGDSFAVPATFVNAGSQPAVGTVLVFGFDHGLTPASYSNCEYLDVHHARLAACAFPDTLAPGDQMTLPDGFQVTVASDAGKFPAVDIYADVAAASPALAARVKTQGKRGTGKALTAAKVTKRAAASRAGDIDTSDNYDFADIEVTNSHFDAAAVGTTVTGAAGAVVSTLIGVKNNGPAALDGDRPQEPPIWFSFSVPTGTTAVEVPHGCQPVADDNTPGAWGQTGGTYYRCVVPTLFVGAGETVTVAFSLKITNVVVSAKGAVSLNDKFADGAYPDDNAADNTADVIVNLAPIGSGSPSAPATAGGGLPVTGPAVGLIAGTGAIVLTLGAVLVLLGRRRSARG